MIKTGPIEYMYAVFLGTMKHLLKCWIQGKQSVRVPKEKCDFADIELDNLKQYVLSEFVRLPR